MTNLRHGISIGVGSLFILSLMGTSYPTAQSSSIPTTDLELVVNLGIDGNNQTIRWFHSWVGSSIFERPTAVVLDYLGRDQIFVAIGDAEPVPQHGTNFSGYTISEGDKINISLMRSSEEEGFNDAPNSTITIPSFPTLVGDISETPYDRDAVVDLTWNVSDYRWETIKNITAARTRWRCTNTSGKWNSHTISFPADATPIDSVSGVWTVHIDLSTGISSIENESPGATGAGCSVSVENSYVIHRADENFFTPDPALHQESVLQLDVYHATTITVKAL